ncbi:MAG: ABC transporter substrate-binding protein [Acidobacteriota bacterium]|nr:ABC transporter substrate-binding protein [Acidobacteriota bacterium]
MRIFRAFYGFAAGAALLAGMQAAAVPAYAADEGGQKTITDMCGNKVTVPVHPERIAAAHCVSPEKIMTLGEGRVLVTMAQQSPWAYKLFPEIKNARIGMVAPEKLKEMKVDVVLFTPGMTRQDPFAKAGLTTACAFDAARRPMTEADFIKDFQEQVSFFGNLLGPEAKVRADRYNAYFEKKVNQILAITSKIDASRRPKVYYGGMRSNILFGQGRGSVMNWNVEVAGGRYVSQALDDNHAQATVAQVVSWDPDIILVSGLADSADMVNKEPEIAKLRAVKNGKVYLLPQGVYAWDHASNENVLLMIYMAKLFYPEQFKDWDMVKEMQHFYSEVYGKTVSDSDARRILAHQPPE